MRQRVFRVLEGDERDPWGHRFAVFIVGLISLNVLAFILETVDAFATAFGTALQYFEWFSVTVFTVEYVARLWAATTDARYASPVTGRLRFAVTPLALIDFLAILPSYLPLLLPVDLRFIRILRFFRLLRLFKVGRYSESMRTLGNVLVNKREELLLALVVVVVLLVLTSSFMFFAEHEAQPKQFASIPHSMWWAIVTLMTIGYGDIVPVTTLGKILGALTALLGIGMVALPTAILASGFLEEIQKKKGRRSHLCPHCGRDVDAPPEATLLVPEARTR